MTSKSWDSARKAYLTSLRAKLKASHLAESESGNAKDGRWLNGFMAAGFHGGIVSLAELKIELMSAYTKAHGSSMSKAQVTRLERRLTNLCKQ